MAQPNKHKWHEIAVPVIGDCFRINCALEMSLTAIHRACDRRLTMAQILSTITTYDLTFQLSTDRTTVRLLSSPECTRALHFNKGLMKQKAMWLAEEGKDAYLDEFTDIVRYGGHINSAAIQYKTPNFMRSILFQAGFDTVRVLFTSYAQVGRIRAAVLAHCAIEFGSMTLEESVCTVLCTVGQAARVRIL